MADNTQLNLGSGGDLIASDDIGGIKHQRIKMEYGGDGTATEVSWFNPIPVDFDSASHDAFGRHRVSSPLTIFEVQHQYNEQPLIWNDATVGGGTVTHLPDESSVRLRVGTASGDQVVRRTKRNFRYLPGKSQLIYLTSNMGAAKTNVSQRIGYFDDNDGIFFEQTGSGISVVRRTSTSGSVVNNSVPQASWNIDTLDGNGPSGLTIDPSLVQIFVIDLQWLGAGRVRVGVDIGGAVIYCHEFLHANILGTVYMKTANLPISYEIENTGTTASNTDMIVTCCAVISEGGIEKEGYPFSVNNGTTAISVTTRRAILSIRRKSTFNSLTNNGLVLPSSHLVFSGSENVFYEIVHGGTLGGTPSWTSVDPDSIVEYDVAGTTVTGGKVIDSGYIPATSQGNSVIAGVEQGLLSKLSLTNGEIISLVVTSLSTATDVYGSINWHEVY